MNLIFFSNLNCSTISINNNIDNNNSSEQFIDDIIVTRTIKAWIEPDRLLIAPGSSVTFICYIISGDPVYFEWSFNGQSQLKSSSSSSTIKSDLIINNKTLKDSTINTLDLLDSSTSDLPLHRNSLTINNITSKSTGNYNCKIFGIGYKSIKLTSQLTVSQRYSSKSKDIFQLIVSLIIASPFLVGLIIINLIACCGVRKVNSNNLNSSPTINNNNNNNNLAEQSV